jgi:hypothetical protein
MRSYEAARNLFGFMGLCAWGVIITGGIFAFIAGGAVSTGGFGGQPSAMQMFVAVLPGGLIALAGLFGLAMVQMGRTSVDGAEYAQQSLAVSRQQLDLSKQMLAQGKTMAASYAAMLPMKHTQAPNQPDAGANTGATYADQPEAAATSLSTDEDQSTIASDTTSKSAAVTKEEQVLLAPVRHEIVYCDGQFAVGDKVFQTKGAALEFQEELKAAPLKKPLGS